MISETNVSTLTFAGDCTLGSHPDWFGKPEHFLMTVGTDYAYPFRAVGEYFLNDEFTMVNLEGVLADGGTPEDKTYTFRGPTAYSQILTLGGVEAVTLANNHTYDFGYAGYRSTTQTLDGAGVTWADIYEPRLVTTEHGLVIGLVAGNYYFDEAHFTNQIQRLREQGAQIIVCNFHWGNELERQPNADQVEVGHWAIDAGADIVIGHHPHVLQPIEEYHGGIICYSLGNFCFGGNSNPTDKDSVLIQFRVIRTPEGTVTLGDMTAIPMSISGQTDRNDYQPTPLAPESEAYRRVLGKLGLENPVISREEPEN